MNTGYVSEMVAAVSANRGEWFPRSKRLAAARQLYMAHSVGPAVTELETAAAIYDGLSGWSITRTQWLDAVKERMQ